jgi:dihydrodipicolinate synthase/N-acetylneuraminate lyase
MKIDRKFTGIICPILTPFDKKGEVDIIALQSLVDFLIDHGIDGIMPCGTTGEGMLLSIEERKLVAETVVGQTKGRIDVMVHTGCITTAQTIELTIHAQAIGANGASVITPYFFSYDDEALFEFYISVAKTVPDFPIALYCYPGSAKHRISLALFNRLRENAQNIAALKLSDPNLILFQEYVQAGGEEFCTLCGVDALALPALSVGGVGQVSGNANVFPEVFCRLYAAFAAGDLQEAKRQQVMINRIRAIFKDDLVYFKAAMRFRGIRVGDPRPPLRRLNNKELNEMEIGIQKLGLL